MSHYKGSNSEGNRVDVLRKQRERQLEDLEIAKKKLEDETRVATMSFTHKFAEKQSTEKEQQMKQQAYGLLTLEQMKAHQDALEAERERKAAAAAATVAINKKKRKKKKEKAAMSFDLDEEDDPEPETKGSNKKEEKDSDDTASNIKRKKFSKNPDVDTSFLPDREREEQERQERERLRQEWVETQEKIKKEEILITYSYWDGSGHRKNIKMKKGDTIQQFLQGCLMDLRGEFFELRGVNAENLIYVKEDLMIPHHYTFYDFIINKARGKSGPLFNFDVHDDVRLVQDHTIEKDESHAGKVITRGWYERNKHIFPASRWEPYDPQKEYSKYTIR